MHKLKLLNARFFTVLVIAFLAFFILIVNPGTAAGVVTLNWLIYDDGEANDGITNDELGDQCAVGFKLPYNATIAEVAFYIYSDPATFRVNIYSSNASTKLYTRTYTPTKTGWCNVPVTGISVNSVFGDDDFYVAMEPISDKEPSLGWDTNGWGYGRSMFGRPYHWRALERPLGNFMIRAGYYPKPSAKEDPVSTQQVATATGTGTAIFATSNGFMHDLSATTSTACAELPGYSYPHGFFSYNITGIDEGSTVTITITMPSKIPEGAEYWKCINEQWVNVTSLLTDNDGDKVLKLTITDGGLGDGDGAVNGIILDPGGPAIPEALLVTPKPKPVSESPQLPEQLISTPARFSVKYLNVQPQQVQVNEPVNVYASLANGGDEAGNYKAMLKINGGVEEIKTGTVNGHAAVPLQFMVIKDKPGTYEVDINGQKTSFTVAGESKSGIPFDPKIIVFALIGVLVMATIIVMVRHFAVR